MDPERRATYDALAGFSMNSINPFADTSLPADQVFVDEFTCIGCRNVSVGPRGHGCVNLHVKGLWTTAVVASAVVLHAHLVASTWQWGAAFGAEHSLHSTLCRKAPLCHKTPMTYTTPLCSLHWPPW